MLVDRLIKRMQELRAPIVVGLDPQMELMPSYIRREVCNSMVRGRIKHSDYVPEDVVQSNCVWSFMKEVIDHVFDLVPAVKLQSALYEQFGPEGIQCYFELVRYATGKGLFVIGDIKRGDIASSAAGYSRGHIGFNEEMTRATHAPADFVTINPYLGRDSVEPFLEDCKKFDRGLFVLVKTSNRGSADLQDVRLENGKPLYAHVANLVSGWGADSIGEMGYSRVGAVVGATHPSEALEIRKLMPHTFFLVPGYGAQGASGKDLKNMWRRDTYGMIVNSSRGITAAYRSDRFKCCDSDFAKAAREAVIEMKKDLEAHTP